MKQTEFPVTGAALLTLSGLLFASMGMLIRQASVEANNEMVVFARNAIGLALFLPALMRFGFKPFRTRVPGLHLFRGLVGLSAMYCFFYAIAHIPLAEAMLFTYAAPVFVPLISRFWLQEPLSLRTYAAVVTGLCGIILVLKPGPGIFQPLSLIGLAACILAATAFVSVRRLSATEPATRIVFWFMLVATVVSALPAWLSWQELSRQTWTLLLGVGVLATASQIVMSRAYSLAPAGRISPFAYSAIVFSALLAWLAWDEIPDAFTLAGAALVFIAGLMSLAQRKKQPDSV